MQIQIHQTLHCSPHAMCTSLGFVSTVDLPIKTFDEVKSWYIKWDTLHYTLDGEKWHEVPLNSNDGVDCTDWKRPACVSIQDPDTGEVLAEQE